MEQEDIKLVEQCASLEEQVSLATAWLHNNRDIVHGEYDGLQAELRRAGRFFRRCRRAAQRKMCVGVFGPSQAGKSYLISALARDPNGTLLADFGGDVHDFIAEINPEGGKESTGLVTRFTMTKPGAVPDGFPVQIRLLTEMDLVKVLANAYYADCEHSEPPDGQAISRKLEELRKRTASIGEVSSSVTLDDFEELQEYLKKDFQAKPRVQELNRSYWTQAFELGPRMDLEGRILLYSLIWDEVEEFTRLLRQLVKGLDSLGNPDLAYAPIEALIPRQGSIIDVAMLAGLGLDQDADLLEIVSPEGTRAKLPRSVVTALTAELAIFMQNKPDDYFEYTDLLDFPGYRSRYKFDDLRRELQKPDILKEMFLRGKVAYLFQRYCNERELTSMLLCIGPSNQEVQDLPGVINDWVNLAHGEKPENRRDKPVSLYFVLTKFDMEFEQKSGAPSVESRWDNRLHASLLDFFGKQHDWPTNWDGAKAFNNLFLLRNPNFRFDAILDITKEGEERGIRPEQEGIVSDLRKAFLKSSLVAKHFVNPEESWNAAMRLNDGGITFIREKLRPLCNPDIKRRQIETSLKEQLERLVNRLQPFWKTDDKEEKRKQKNQFAAHLLRNIFAKMSDPSYLGEFVNRLCVKDQELYDLYFDVRASMAQVSVEEVHEGPVLMSDVNVDELMDDLFAEDLVVESPQEETEEKEKSRFKDEAAYYASIIESHWLTYLHSLAESQELQKRYGFPERHFSEFISEVALGCARLKLRETMETALRKAVAYANIHAERLVWKQASLAAAVINAYVDFLGYNPRTVSEEERTIQGRERAIVLFPKHPEINGFPKLSPVRGSLSSSWKNDWLRAVAGCIAANVDFDGSQIINVEQNRMLGEIIRYLNNIDHN